MMSFTVSNSQFTECPEQDRFLRVDAVFGLVPDARLRAVDHRVDNLVAAMRGQAMEKDRIAAWRRSSIARRPDRVPSRRSCCCAWSCPIDTHVSVTTRSAPVTAFARVAHDVDTRSLRTRGFDKPAIGIIALRNPRADMRNRASPAASISEERTLLPSPSQRVRARGSALPLSTIVSRSATIWHGCDRSVSPLITGTLAYSANSSTLAWSSVRIMITSA